MERFQVNTPTDPISDDPAARLMLAAVAMHAALSNPSAPACSTVVLAQACVKQADALLKELANGGEPTAEAARSIIDELAPGFKP